MARSAFYIAGAYISLHNDPEKVYQTMLLAFGFFARIALRKGLSLGEEDRILKQAEEYLRNSAA
jgi:hypothetical protein